MKLGKSPDNKWVLIENKKIVHTYDTKEEAILNFQLFSKDSDKPKGPASKPKKNAKPDNWKPKPLYKVITEMRPWRYQEPGVYVGPAEGAYSVVERSSSALTEKQG